MLGNISAWKHDLKGSYQDHALPVLAGIVALLIVPVARYGNKAIAPLFVVFVLAVMGLWIARRRPIRISAPGWIMAVFAILSLASALWSITPMISLKTALSVTGSLAGAYLLSCIANSLSAEEKRAVGVCVAYGGLIGVLILIVDTLPRTLNYALFHDDSVYDLNVVTFWNERKSAFIVAMVFIWPWAAAAWRHLSRALVLAILFVFAVMVAGSKADAARGALIIGLTAALAAIYVPRLLAAMMSVAVIVAVIAFPLIVPHLTSPTSPEATYNGFSESALHRIIIWQNTVVRIEDRPWFGYGFDTARNLYRGHPAEEITILPSSERRLTVTTEPIPLHPHNIILQIWAEIGALGSLLLAAFVIAIIRAIGRSASDPISRMTAFGALSSGLFIANVSVGAWQAWWLATLILTATLLIANLSRHRET